MSTFNVNEDNQKLVSQIVAGDKDELNEIKSFLFRENIRLELEKKELNELKDKVFNDRERLRLESDEVNKKILEERKRLKEEQMFFDKKLQILKNGFEALEADRKALSNARKQFEYERSLYQGTNSSHYSTNNDELTVQLFKGVNSFLSLKKRYKDLLKIFHPDNMGGDHEMIHYINKTYEELKKNYEGSKII